MTNSSLSVPFLLSSFLLKPQPFCNYIISDFQCFTFEKVTKMRKDDVVGVEEKRKGEIEKTVEDKKQKENHKENDKFFTL